MRKIRDLITSWAHPRCGMTEVARGDKAPALPGLLTASVLTLGACAGPNVPDLIAMPSATGVPFTCAETTCQARIFALPSTTDGEKPPAGTAYLPVDMTRFRLLPPTGRPQSAVPLVTFQVSDDQTTLIARAGRDRTLGFDLDRTRLLIAPDAVLMPLSGR